MTAAKGAIVVFMLILSGSWGPAYADYYSWKDDSGRWHLADDLQKIPGPYRTKAKRHVEQTLTDKRRQAAPEAETDPPPANVLGRIRGELVRGAKDLAAPLFEQTGFLLKNNAGGRPALKGKVRLLLPAGLLTLLLFLAAAAFRRRSHRRRESEPAESRPKKLYQAPLFGLLTTPLSTKRMAHLCRRWASACEAGIPVINTLEMLRKSASGKERRLIHNLAERIRGGDSLAEALRAEKKYLPPVFIEILAAGEQGGHLDRALGDLSRYFEDLLGTERRVTSMLSYPALQLILAWFLGTLGYRVARAAGNAFSDSANAFDFSRFFREYLLFQCRAMMAAGGGAAGCWLLYRLGLFKFLWRLVSAFAWPLARTTRKFSLARFFRTLSLLIGSGMRIDRCIERAAAAALHPLIGRDLKRSIGPIRNGSNLAEAFGRCRFLDAAALEMLRSAEQAGDLERQAENIAAIYQSEAGHALDLTLKILGVLIMLCVILFIAWLVVNIYGELFESLQAQIRRALFE